MKFSTLPMLMFLATIRAWNLQTHMIIARIAYDILEKESPGALRIAEEILSLYTDDIIKEDEGEYPFVECVAYADIIKYRGGAWQKGWHYDNLPFFSNGTDASDYDLVTLKQNITNVMPALYQWLKGDANVSDSKPFQTIMSRVDAPGEGLSIALRLLMHYVGDIHQPFHSTTRYSPENPSGDLGGNRYTLKNRYGAKNLHAVWDKVIYKNKKNSRRPLSKQSWADIGEQADFLMETYAGKLGQKEIQSLDFALYRDESNEIVKNGVYDGIQPGYASTIPKWYKEKFLPIAERRVTLAGHRLAYVIQDLFDPQ